MAVALNVWRKITYYLACELIVHVLLTLRVGWKFAENLGFLLPEFVESFVDYLRKLVHHPGTLN